MWWFHQSDDDHDDGDGDVLFTDKDKDGDECERPPKTHKRRKKRRVVILISPVTIDVADVVMLFSQTKTKMAMNVKDRLRRTRDAKSPITLGSHMIQPAIKKSDPSDSTKSKQEFTSVNPGNESEFPARLQSNGGNAKGETLRNFST